MISFETRNFLDGSELSICDKYGFFKIVIRIVIVVRFLFRILRISLTFFEILNCIFFIKFGIQQFKEITKSMMLTTIMALKLKNTILTKDETTFLIFISS